MTETDTWKASYGPQDGPWLQEEFRRYTQDLGAVDHVRIAWLDDEEEMARFREEAEAGDEIAAKSNKISGDWEVTSPHTGRRYMIGCDWQNADTDEES